MKSAILDFDDGSIWWTILKEGKRRADVVDIVDVVDVEDVDVD